MQTVDLNETIALNDRDGKGVRNQRRLPAEKASV